MSDPYASMKTGYTRDDASPEEVARQAAVVGPLAESVRELIDAVIRSEVDPEEMESVRKEIEVLTERLRVKQLPGAFGVRISQGRGRAWGNPVVGLRNAMSPPLVTVKEPDGLVWAETVLGARFEGPPGMVHGGVSSLLLDQMVGEAASAVGAPGMTGKLSLRYLRPTPLGPIRFEAKAEPSVGVKTLVRAWSVIGEGEDREVCVEAEAIMILPRWAREQIEAAKQAAEVGGDALPEPRPNPFIPRDAYRARAETDETGAN